MNAPRKLVGTPFYIRLNIGHKKGQVITDFQGNLFKIIKTYHLTWWRKILKWFGVKLRDSNTYKVKHIGQTLL